MSLVVKSLCLVVEKKTLHTILCCTCFYVILVMWVQCDYKDSDSQLWYIHAACTCMQVFGVPKHMYICMYKENLRNALLSKHISHCTCVFKAKKSHTWYMTYKLHLKYYWYIYVYTDLRIQNVSGLEMAFWT